MNDNEIINQIYKNSMEANRGLVTNLYQSNYELVSKMIMQKGGNLEDSKDIFQEAMIIFYNNIKNQKLSLNCKISTYLYSVAKNMWLKKIRDKKLQVVSMDSVYESEIKLMHDPIEEPTRKQISIAQLLSSGGDKCQKLLQAFYYEKQSMKDIAAMLGLSNSQVAKNQKVRCLKKIRLAFENTNSNNKITTKNNLS